MVRFINTKNYTLEQPQGIGIILVNLGTPSNPNPAAIRKFLGDFLSDPRVTEMPTLIRQCILHLFVLPFRPYRLTKQYAKIWMEGGSPLLVFSKAITACIRKNLCNSQPEVNAVALAMRYGEPSIEGALSRFNQQNINRLLVLPLFPQYSATTTASVFDKVTSLLSKYRKLFEMRFITGYHDHPEYILGCAKHICRHWKKFRNKQGHILVLTFHGLPKRNLLLGDPYYCYCTKTARLIAHALGLEKHEWVLTFQSRFGKQEWLKPYTDEVIANLPKHLGIKHAEVFCPGFSVDCLETLEEIAIRNKKIFLDHGGVSFNYIPALNEGQQHIKALETLIHKHLQGWGGALSPPKIPLSPPTLSERQQNRD